MARSFARGGGLSTGLHRWLNLSGWPLLADPLAALAPDCPNRIEHWELQLDRLNLPDDAQVLRLGPMPASRRLEAWLQRHQGPQLLITEGDPRPLDPLQKWPANGPGAWPLGSPNSLVWSKLSKPSVGTDDLSAWIEAQLPLRGAVNEPALAYWLPQLLPERLPADVGRQFTGARLVDLGRARLRPPPLLQLPRGLGHRRHLVARHGSGGESRSVGAGDR